ncbi:MAG: hypothetical protein R6W90_08870 [Ignavibacteriaceae bacterium]
MDAVKKFSPALFIIIIFCFVLPFINITCSGQEIMSVTGIQLITGTDYEPGEKFIEEGMFDNNYQTDGIDSQPMAILALLAAIAALVLSFNRSKIAALFCMVVSVLGAFFLLLLKINLDSETAGSGEVMVKINYLFAYWFSLLVFVAGAITEWMIYKEMDTEITEVKSPPVPVDKNI